jgi:hypothetical protein
MKEPKRVQGQILVIILLVLSILSIFILAMVSNARKDSQERRDNARYEQFYAIAEEKLIESQDAVGIQQISLERLYAYMPDYDCTTAIINETWLNSEAFQCTKTEEFSSYETASLDTITSTIYLSDNPVLNLYELVSDNNMRIALKKGTTTYTGGINLYWNATNNENVDWVITLDYFVQSSTPDDASYKSFKVSTLDLTQPSSTPNIIKTSDPYSVNGLTFYNGISFSISDLLAGAGGIPASSIENLRIKPIVGSATTKIAISIVPASPSDFPSQFRRITSIINSTASLTTASDSPTTILNLSYPVSLPINPLLDYVYRGGYLEQTTTD